MKRLTTSFLDLFLLLLMSVVVMVKPVADDSPEELSHFVVTATWADVGNDVDLWGQKCDTAKLSCGFTAREIGNLRLHGDWTTSTASMQSQPKFAFETLTIDSLEAGEYGFALQGYGVQSPTVVSVTVASVKPYRVWIRKELTVDKGLWVTIGRITIDADGSVTNIDESLEVQF